MKAQSKKDAELERSELRLRMKHLEKSIKSLRKTRAMLSGFWNSDPDNKDMFRKMDICCIELIAYFREQGHIASKLLGYKPGKLIVTALSDV